MSDLIARPDIGRDAYDLPLGNGVVAEFTYDEDEGFRFYALRLAKNIAIDANPNHAIVNLDAQNWLRELLPADA